MSNVSALLPFLTFAVVMTGTPGPNNAMVATSAARIGAWRTMPLVMGITAGAALMFVAMAFGLGSLLAALPALGLVFRIAAAVLLLWIAWKIFSAGPVGASEEQPLLGFFGGAAFQWMNPKAWAMTSSAATVYLPNPTTGIDIAAHAAILWCAGVCLVSLWALLGDLLRRPLREPGFARMFNTIMASLLVAATVPVLLNS